MTIMNSKYTPLCSKINMTIYENILPTTPLLPFFSSPRLPVVEFPQPDYWKGKSS